MPDQLFPGRRTLFERNGKEFELPDPHTAKLLDAGKLVSLSTPFEGGTYWVTAIDRADDLVVVHVGDAFGEHHAGLARDSGQPPPFRGYPFPD